MFLDTEEQIRLVRAELLHLKKEKTRGAMIRAKANWAFVGEMPMKYFLNKEKQNYTNKTLYQIMKENEEITTDESEILKEIQNFYQKLYTAGDRIDKKYVDNLEILVIPLVLREELERPIEIQEISVALSQLKNQKSPGCDGLPVEFYKVFYDKLKPFLHELYLEIVKAEELHLTAKRGILSLLEKVGKDAIFLNHWHPLTLLNMDNKIYPKILANRLEKCQKYIIHHSQTGFCKGRHLAENIIKILQVTEKCDRKKVAGILVSFDFMKAFDTIAWDAIYFALEKFGFGPKYIQMVRILYKDPQVCASNNGVWPEFFKPTRATRQGCCYSPGIFNLVVEILGIGIRQNKNIRGIEMNGTEIKARQFADDLWTTLLGTEENLNETLREINRFGRLSGLKINPEKCAILRLGPFKSSNAKYYTLRQLYWSPGPIRILGINIHTDPSVLYQCNYEDTIRKAEDVLRTWASTNLTVIGKITVINSLVNTLFIHKFLSLPTPPARFFKRYKSMVQKFLWGDKKSQLHTIN